MRAAEAMAGVALALVGAYGVFLLYTAAVFRWRGIGLGPRATGRRRDHRARLREWMIQAGLDDTRPVELGGVMAVLGVVGAALAFGLFGGLVPPLAGGAFAASLPVTAARARRRRRLAQARENWPRMIEEIRLQATTMGRSVPQALFAVGMNGPDELRPAFVAARREWMISADFTRTVGVLKEALADPTADAVCETLLVANEVGGSDVNERLLALIEDRQQDLQGRKDAMAKQAGARFARRFVLFVPLGMALAGLMIGTGRQAYQSPLGQVLVAAAIAMMAACWLWAGRFLRLPEEERVFSR